MCVRLHRHPVYRYLALAFILAAGHSHAGDIADHGVILLYHHVADNTPAVTSIGPVAFDAQMQYLERNNFLVWPLPRLVAALEDGSEIPDRVVAISFDDNYQSVYFEAFPRLKQRGWPFTIFVSTDAVDQGINKQASWAQLREMVGHGATVANHTASHAHLLQLAPGEKEQDWARRVTADIDRAQRRIREETGQETNLFAYPYGEFNRPLVKLVEQLGYVGIGQQSGAAGAHHAGLAIPRFPVAGNYTKLEDFAIRVLALPLPVETFEAEDGPLSFGSPPPTLILNLVPGDYTPKALQCFDSGKGALTLQWLSQWQVKVLPKGPLPTGRSRFNCTLPTNIVSNGVRRYFWYSQPWVRADEQGRLLD